ncbi:uncharacterized protein [Aegilops tauschii subsp. strangulata]|uniref:uncharacterized protein n=1 Tax=Aegilops tauschii subsp. strangulata TaxID=200361 RepID=UPI003CC8DEF3
MARMARDTSSAAWPQLMLSNYANWVVLMQVMMEGWHLWDAVQTGTAERSEDRLALKAILRGVPPETGPTLAAKATVKETWDSLKTMRLGVARVREGKLATLTKQYDDIKFAEGESVDEFAMRLTTMVAQMVQLSETILEKRVIRKFLSVVPKQFSQIALSIETLVDLDTLSVEELTGTLKAAEEHHELHQATDEMGRLLLTEEEWHARLKTDDQHTGGFGAGSSRGRRGTGHGHRGGGGGGCGQNGKKKRDEEANALLAQGHGGDNADPTHLLMAQVCDLSADPGDRDWHVELFEERVVAHLGLATDAHSGVWYLDIGASNHMSGEEVSFSELDRHVTGTIKFGDRSFVDIQGRGCVLFTDHAGGHRVLSSVYFMSRLKSNIISVCQLDQIGCPSEIEHDIFTLYDQQR